jgi:hypothetical protein
MRWRTEDHHILYWPLAQIMIDTKYVGLCKDLVQGPIELLRGREVCAERLLHNDAGVLNTARFSELIHHGPE